MFRRIHYIARTIRIEAIRRKEIYSIVLLTIVMLGWAATFRFFDMEGLHKFYQEVSLKIMSVSTMITVIVLAARQLPREFESRTIYTVLAKPISRFEFILGKYVGVVLAGSFCLALFMIVFAVANLILGYPILWSTFGQFIYLQFLLINLIASLSFVLSLLFNQDASITLTAMLYLLGQIFTGAVPVIYEFADPLAKSAIKILNYIIPQTALYDLSAKVVHAWPPISLEVMLMLTGYTAVFCAFYLFIGFILFRRRPL